MKTILILFLVSVRYIGLPDTEEYVCLPCGQGCDTKIYSLAGRAVLVGWS